MVHAVVRVHSLMPFEGTEKEQWQKQLVMLDHVQIGWWEWAAFDLPQAPSLLLLLLLLPAWRPSAQLLPACCHCTPSTASGCWPALNKPLMPPGLSWRERAEAFSPAAQRCSSKPRSVQARYCSLGSIKLVSRGN
eukprot:1147374-Pelagomonas_calceolata.AAC.2